MPRGVLEPQPVSSSAAANMAATLPVRARQSAAIVVLKSNDVVLPGVLPELNLDDDQPLVVIVGNAMDGTAGHVDALALASLGLTLPDRAGGDSAHHHPVLRAVLVGLKRQPRMRVHGDALDLEALTPFEDVP